MLSPPKKLNKVFIPKASVACSLKVLEATFYVGVKTKRPTRNPVCIRETPVKV